MRFSIKLLCLVIVFVAEGARAEAQSVTISPTSGRPNLAVTVTGASFGGGEAVDIYIDLVDTLLSVSSSSGAVSASVTIPTSAAPGLHYITAIGRRTGDAAQTSFTVSSAWAEYGFGAAHHSFNPYENTISASNVGTLGPLWSVTPNGSAGSGGGGGTPAVSGGRVFAGSFSGVQARSVTTGAVVWSRSTAESFTGSPAVAGALVYAGSLSGNLYALNVNTGAVIWSKALGGAIYSSPVVSGGIVYVGCFGDNKVYAINAATGAIIWTLTTGGRIESSPAVVNGIIYIGSNDDKLYALNAATGAIVWSYATGGAVESSPAIANGVVYVGSDDDKIYALNAASGGLVWSYATGGLVASTPAVAYGNVYIGSYDGNMYSLDARTGILQWSIATNGAVRAAAVANGVVYATSADANGRFFAFAAAPEAILASGLSGPSGFFGSPAVCDGVLYVNAYQGALSAFALLAGNDPKRPAAHGTATPPAISSLHPNFSLPLTY